MKKIHEIKKIISFEDNPDLSLAPSVYISEGETYTKRMINTSPLWTVLLLGLLRVAALFFLYTLLYTLGKYNFKACLYFILDEK
jgi:hypothetical protein